MYYPPKPRKKSKKKIILTILCLIIFIFLLTGTYYFPFVVKAIEENSFPAMEGAVVLLDKEGNEFYKEYNDYRIKVSKEKIPSRVKEGLIIMEDKRFYNHTGVDFRGIMRAVAANFKEKDIVQGGSTITQQLARNYFLSNEKTINRKIKELIFSLYLESSLSKNEILEKYLNKVYFGHGAYGVETASRIYFDKNVEELDLGEKALLIGLIRGPYAYSPYKDKEAARERRNLVLNEMESENIISREELENAKNSPIELAGQSPIRPEKKAPYFADKVIKRLEDIMESKGKNIYEGGVRVYTTLDKELQTAGRKVINKNLPVVDTIKTGEKEIRQPQGALVAVEASTGEVRALVGGRNYEESEFNRAIMPVAAPGSIFKTYVYAAAFEEEDYHPATMVSCKEKEFDIPGNGTYKPTEFDGGYHNEDLTVRRAIIESCNVAAVSVHKDIGPEIGVEYAFEFGMEGDFKPWLSFPLGPFETSPLEVAKSHIPLANEGVRQDTKLIRKIENNRGQIIYKNNREGEYVLDRRVVYQLNNILKDVISPVGTASSIHERLNFEAAGKTGTAGGGRSASFVGYTPEMVAFVHVKRDDYEKINGTGGSLAAPLWLDFMEEASEMIDFGEFKKPDGLNSKKICQQSGKIATPDCPEEDVYEEYFIPGKAPDDICEKHFDIPSFPWGVW